MRTYVSCGGKPGVYFFSLDATEWIAVAMARRWFHLAYHRARMQIAHRNGRYEYSSARTSDPCVEFRGRYAPNGDGPETHENPLERWLTERYCLYATDGRGGIWRGDIHHHPWPLQTAECEIAANTMAEPLGLRLPSDPPLGHYARRVDALVWRPTRVSPG